MSVRIVRLGTDRAPDEGVRMGMAEPSAARTLDVLALLSKQADFAVGCYCEDFSRRHRSILKQLLAEHGAKFADGSE